MIELIFVIVILGILAAVAIPKLAATRDDAKIAKAATDISTAINDIGSYYTAKGKFSNKLRDMTSVQISDDATKFEYDGDLDLNGTTAIGYYTDTTDTSAAVGCIGFYVSAKDGNLTVTSESNGTATCTGINKAVARLIKVHTFGGSSINY